MEGGGKGGSEVIISARRMVLLFLSGCSVNSVIAFWNYNGNPVSCLSFVSAL